MKELFKNRVNIILVSLLLVSLVLMGILGYSVLKPDTNVYAINFNGYTDEEIKAWCEENEISDKCKLTYEYNNNIPANTMIYQSILEGSPIGQNITFTISKGKELNSVEPLKLTNELTKDDVVKWANSNNLKYVEYIDKYNNEISKGIVISIEPNENLNTETKIVVTISLGEQGSRNTISVSTGEYIGLTVDEFEAKAKQLGLNAKYTNEYDEYSSNIKKDLVIWHGSGEYEVNENFRYSLSLGKDPNAETIEIKKDQFVKLTEAQIKEEATKLGLKAVHNSEWDKYNNSIEKGLVIQNGFGIYEKDENLRYGLSLGKENNITYPLTIEKEKYTNISEDSFISKANELGLKAVKTSEYEDYSDSLEKGKVIWHGSGEYEKGEDFRYSLSLGKKVTYPLSIKNKEYVNNTEEEFKKIASGLGLKPVHNSEWDDYSDTIAKGNIIFHGNADDYYADESLRYGLSLGKKNEETSDDEEFEIIKGTYLGYSEQEFINKAKELGLEPVHNESWDDYSSTIEKGKIVFHGFASDYKKGEKFRYGLSLGTNSQTDMITITANQYVGKSVSEFESAMSALGLQVSYVSSNDNYSNNVQTGNIVYHESGSFAKGSTIKYGKSLGANPKITVNTGYVGKTEEEFKSYINGLGLNPVKSGTENSDTYVEGLVLSYSTGSFNKGANISYTLSSGKKKLYLLKPNILQTNYAGDTFDETKNKLKNYLDNQGFTNYSFKNEKSRDYGQGVILEVKVNGSSFTNTAEIDYDSTISITICDGRIE